MATNPRIPEDEDLHPKLPPQKQQTGAPWVLVAIVVAALLLAALVIWMPRSPRATRTPSAAEVPSQPTGSQLQFTNLKLVPSPVGNAVDLDGAVQNNGSTDVTGIAVNAAFQDSNGRNLETIPAKVMGVEGGKSGGTTQDLTQAPIKPGQTRPIRIGFDRVPEGWNRQLPALTVTAVTAAGNPGQNTLKPPITKQEQQQGDQGRQAQPGAPPK